ncbi:hypothetical protein BDM02DRAFT_3193586 [Thelephora ganbajun]|uniref:Uncharacterized protein n=1 Tax=Thelephora ganbajun TaxID=370292 RepID=A0ACB6YYV7_THEGA|nr:hypothetical protein BDM02DRAFT_3193586 [Thelephora ganbajun]
MSFQHNKVFVSSRNQNITRYVVGSVRDQNILDANHPEELANAVLASEGWEMPCRVFQSYGSFNDQMWQQCISSLRNIDENCRNRSMYDDEEVLFQLIERGIVDLDSSDDVAVGSIIRYTAVVGERLWSLLESQQAMKGTSTQQWQTIVEKESTFPPREVFTVSCDPSSSQTVEDPIPVIRKFGGVDPFIDVPLSALEGRKHRQREWFQHAQEAKASKHPVTPPVDTNLGDVTVLPSEFATVLASVENAEPIPVPPPCCAPRRTSVVELSTVLCIITPAEEREIEDRLVGAWQAQGRAAEVVPSIPAGSESNESFVPRCDMPVVMLSRELQETQNLGARGYRMLLVMRAVTMMPNSTVSACLLSSDHEEFDSLLSGELEAEVHPVRDVKVVHSRAQDDDKGLEYSDEWVTDRSVELE